MEYKGKLAEAIKLSDRPYLFPTLMTSHSHLQSSSLPINERDEFMVRNGFAIPIGTSIIEIINESEDGLLIQKIVYKNE